MNKREDGGPAFPAQANVWRGRVADDAGTQKIYEPVQFTGLTLRDYFAAAALSSLVAIAGNRYVDQPTQQDQDAKTAYKYADAMLAERAK